MMSSTGQIPGVRTPRAIVIMSSVKESSAGDGLENALMAARSSGIPVYFVQLMPEQFDDRVNPALARVAQESGGQVFNAALVSLDTILAELGELLLTR